MTKTNAPGVLEHSRTATHVGLSYAGRISSQIRREALPYRNEQIRRRVQGTVEAKTDRHGLWRRTGMSRYFFGRHRGAGRHSNCQSRRKNGTIRAAGKPISHVISHSDSPARPSSSGGIFRLWARPESVSGTRRL